MDNMDTANLGIMCGIIVSLGFFAMIFGTSLALVGEPAQQVTNLVD